MKKIVLAVLGGLLVMASSCGVQSNKATLSKFTSDINIVKSYYPGLYDKYMDGEIVITDVYKDLNNPKGYGVDYRYICFRPDSTKTPGGWR